MSIAKILAENCQPFYFSGNRIYSQMSKENMFNFLLVVGLTENEFYID